MKRVLFLILLGCLSLSCRAQTQQGMVKTKGRMVNGKHVPGQGLSGATVTIQGRSAVLSHANGAFSFPIPSKTFTLQSVQKQGYQLVDADVTRKAYQYSPNTFYLLMETPEQQMEDLLDAQERISKTLRAELKKARGEIQRLKDEGRITEEQYLQRIAQLMADQQNNQKLIADMANEYAKMDYDQMDDLNRQISDAILNGELTKADSLLRSKGDIGSRVVSLRKAQEAETQREVEIAKEQEELAASKAGTKRKLVDLAQDCKNYFDRFKMSNQHDSAAYYIELRAELDTTNAKWQFEAAHYLQGQNQFKKAGLYYERTLSIYRRLTQESPQTYEPYVALTLNNLAILYKDTQRFSESEEMNNEALEIRRRLAQANPQTYEPDVALTLNNLALLYNNTQRFSESEEMNKEALEIHRRLAQANPQAYEPYVATTLNNLANLYSDTQRFSESEERYKEALAIYRHLAQQNPQTYEPYVATTLNNLANLYSNTQRFEEAEKMFLSALETYQRLAADNPKVYEPSVAMTQYNLANLYMNTQRFSESEQMNKEALEIRRRLAQSNPQTYEPYVAQTQYNIGLLRLQQKQFVEAIPPFEEALDIYRRIAKNIAAYQQWYMISLYWLSQLYAIQSNYEATYWVNKEWIPVLRNKYEADHDAMRVDYAQALGSQSFSAIFMKHYAEAEQYAREGLAVDSAQHWIATNLAAALLIQGKYAEAECIYRQYKNELKDSFLDDFRQFAEAGVIPPECEADVEKIKRLLVELK